MKQSEKFTIPAGILLLITAAVILISILLQFLTFGAYTNFPLSSMNSFGHLLYSAYGISTFLIPVFLFVAAILMFLPTWSASRGIYLIASIVPFFTISLMERLGKSILTDVSVPMQIMKTSAILLICVLLVSIEYLITGLIIDIVLGKKAKKGTFVPVFEVNDEGNPIPEEIMKESSTITAEEESVETETATDTGDVTNPQPAAEYVREEEPVDFSQYADMETVGNSDADSPADTEEPAEAENAGDVAQAEDEGPTIEEAEAEMEARMMDGEPESDCSEKASESQDSPVEDAPEDVPLHQPAEIPLSQVNELSKTVPGFEDERTEQEPVVQDCEIQETEVPAVQEEAPEPVAPDVPDEPVVQDEPEIITINFDGPSKEEPELITLNFNQSGAPELELLEEDRPVPAQEEQPAATATQESAAAESTTDAPAPIKTATEHEAPVSSHNHEAQETVPSAPEPVQSEPISQDTPGNTVTPDDFYSADEEAFLLDPFEEENAETGEEADTTDEDETSQEAGDLLPPQPKDGYHVPTEGLLNSFENNPYWIIDDETRQAGNILKETLSEFKIEAEITGIRKGPVITMFEILPAPGVKLNRIAALQDNIALRLAASSVRIVAPIPGKQAVGVEVPNRERAMVSFRELIEKDLPAFNKMQIPVVLGKDITGDAQMLDLTATPHLLIAGSTGSGKSVCVNSMILSILYKRSPKDVKMILIDPKIVELKLYNDIPHLLTPVITEPKKAFQALQYCLCEMERRYAMLDHMGVRDIKTYNRRISERHIMQEKLPYIVVIIDEFADLMATTGKELESTVARLAAMSRAVGIHLVLATQRPSIDVITGLIKANIPTRIAFMVASKTDSRIIIDQTGSEKLLGKGDMLYASAIDPFPVRIQGTFVTEDEVENVVNYVKQYGEPDYIDDEIFVDDDDDDAPAEDSLFTEGEDPLYDKALEIVVQAGKASASYIQRRLKIGYNRAARLVEEMEERGIVGPANGSKPREVIHIP